MRTAVIIAGGLGTRLRPLTYTTPKPLVDIDGRNLAEHTLLLLKRAGVTTAYFAIGYLAEKVVSFFGDEYCGVRIKYLVETEPLGTGGWMHQVSEEQRREDFSEDFIVVNVDDLSDLDFRELEAFHQRHRALISISLHRVADVRAFGVAELEGDRILRFVEKPTPEDAPSDWVNYGHYLFSPRVFGMLPKEKRFMFEYDLFPKVAAAGGLFGHKYEGVWMTTNTFEQLERVRREWHLPEK